MSKYTEEEQNKIIEYKEKIHKIHLSVVNQLIEEFPEKDRWLAGGRVINSLVDQFYKPMLVRLLEEKGSHENT